MNMTDMCEREKIAKEIEKTSKKHCTLKVGRIVEDMALDRYFKPVIKPLRQIVHKPGRAIKRELCYDDAVCL